jgi:hypothetical protein
MRKKIMILGVIIGILFGLSSCKKRARSCGCKGVRYASQSQLQTVLDRYDVKSCMKVVANGGYKVDSGVELYCHELIEVVE